MTTVTQQIVQAVRMLLDSASKAEPGRAHLDLLNLIATDAAARAQEVRFSLLGGRGNAPTRGELRSNEIGVAHTTFGVELQPLGFAPFGELVRVKVHTEDPGAFGLESFAVSLGCGKPLIVGPMEYVTVLEHGSKDGERFTREPREPHDLNLHKASAGCGVATVVQQPVGGETP